MTSQNISCRVDPDTYAKLIKLSKQEDRKLADVIRRLLRKALAKS